MPRPRAPVGEAVRGIHLVIDTRPGHLKRRAAAALLPPPRTKSRTRLRKSDEHRIFQELHSGLPMSNYLGASL